MRDLAAINGNLSGGLNSSNPNKIFSQKCVFDC